LSERNSLTQELEDSKQNLKRKELDGEDLLILQEKTKILKLTVQVLGGVEPIDSTHAQHQTYRISLIRDIISSYPPTKECCSMIANKCFELFALFFDNHYRSPYVMERREFGFACQQ
jgi:hypothetical protein